jgi:hypothetical protein
MVIGTELDLRVLEAPGSRPVLITPLGVIEVEVFLIGQGYLEPETPIPGGGLSEIEVGLPPVKVTGQGNEVVVEGALDEVEGGSPADIPVLGQTEADVPL